MKGNYEKEIPIQKVGDFQEYAQTDETNQIKMHLQKKYKKEIRLIVLWISCMTMCWGYYVYIIFTAAKRNDQLIHSEISLGLVIFYIIFLIICLFRVLERKQLLKEIECDHFLIKKVNIHHLLKGIHLFQADAKITAAGENAIAYVFSLDRHQLRDFKTNKQSEWALIKITGRNIKYEILSPSQFCK